MNTEKAEITDTGKTKLKNSLENLALLSTLAADTGDVSQIEGYPIKDLTTNPSLVLKVGKDNQLAKIADELGADVDALPSSSFEKADHMFAMVGVQAMRKVPGLVSVEVPAHFSYATEKSLAHARRLCDLVDFYGKPFAIDRRRVLIKMAATWQGLQATEVLEREGIACNLTLVFSIVQAIKATEVGATVISPFVGRLSDYESKTGKSIATNPEKIIESDPLANDMGVRLVRDAAHYALENDRGRGKGEQHTRVLAASFRSVEQVLAVAGSPIITISPQLLKELSKMSVSPISFFAKEQKTARQVLQALLERCLPTDIHATRREILLDKLSSKRVDEQTFQELLARDVAATWLLADGIRRFDDDYAVLMQQLDR